MQGDFIENLAPILTDQTVDDWECVLRNSPEVYKMLLIEFQSEVIEEVKRQAKL